MKKLLVLLTLSILLFGSLSVQAEYSDELDDEEYTWELTVWDVSEKGNIEEGDEFTIIFNEPPAGLTFFDIDGGFEYNGDSYDPSASEEFTAKDTIFLILVFGFAVEDPATTFEGEGYTTDGDETTFKDEGVTIVYDTESGLMESLESTADGDTMMLELDQGFFSFLPINPFFFLFTLLAIPMLRKFKN